MLFNLLQFKGKADSSVSANNGSNKIDSGLRMPQASDPSLNLEQANLLQEFSSLGVLKGKIEKLLGVIKEESFLQAKKELGFEIKNDSLKKARNERIKLEQELSQLCKREGIDFEQTLGKRLRAFSDRFQEKTKEILTERIEDQLAKRSFYEKLSAWGTTAFRSYLKVEEFALEAVGGIKERISVFCKEFFLNNKSFNDANELGITAAAAHILETRNHYQDKYQDSFWGDDKKFAGTGDIQAAIKIIPISPLSDLVFGTAIGLIDLTFKDELGNFVYNSWNNVAIALNYEEARITNRKEFIRWWGHGVEAIEVLGAAALIASSGGTAGIGLAEKAFRVSKYLGSSGAISFLSAVSQEWVDEKPDDYFRALENAGTNMGSSALFVIGLSNFSKISSVDKASNLNNKLLTKAKISGITAKAVDLLDDGGDVLEAGEQLAQTGLGTSDKEQGALLGMGVALFSARDTNSGKSNKLNSKELDALLPEIDELLIPEVINKTTKPSRKISCALKIQGQEIEVLRSPDGKRYYLEEGLIREKYYEDRLLELIEYNQGQPFSGRMGLSTLEQIAREESERKIAYTDERKGVCYLPMVTDEMREILSAKELRLKEIYYRSVEIHEVEELRKLTDATFAEIELEQRIETEKNPYTMQADFISRWTDYQLSFQGGVQSLSRAGLRLDNVRSFAFANYIRNSYSEIPTRLAAADGYREKNISDFPLDVQKSIVKRAIDKYFLLYLRKDPQAPKFHEYIIANLYNKLKKTDFKQMQDPNFLSNQLSLIFGRNSDSTVQQITEHLIHCIISECEILSIREYYQQTGEIGLISSPGNDQILSSDLPIIIDYGAGFCKFSEKLHLNNPNAIILAIEPSVAMTRDEYANLFQLNPRTIHYVGQGEDLEDNRVKRKAKIIYMLFPMPNLFFQGVIPKFINDFLAPNGEVVLVSDSGNKGYHPERVNIHDIPFAQFTASIIEVKSLLTEVRRLNSALLPPALHSTFYQTTFAKPDKHLVSIGGEYASGFQTVDSNDLLSLKHKVEGDNEVFQDLGEVGNLYLDVVKIENIEEDQRAKVALPLASKTKAELWLLTSKKGEEKLVISCFAKNNSKIIDVIFRKRADSWEVFYNRAPGQNQAAEIKAFEDALRLFLELSKNDPRFKTETLAIEVDWERLGIKSLDQNIIDQAVQRLLKTNEFTSLSDWQYQNYQITNTDPQEATGIFLRLNFKDATKAVVATNVPTRLATSNRIRIKKLENFSPEVQEYILNNAINSLFDKISQPHFELPNKTIRQIRKALFKFLDLRLPYQQRIYEFVVDLQNKDFAQSTIDSLIENLQRNINNECQAISAREYYGFPLILDSITSPNHEIFNQGKPIVVEIGADSCEFSLQLHKRYADSAIVAIEEFSTLTREQLLSLFSANPRFAYFAGRLENFDESRIKHLVLRTFLMFPSPKIFPGNTLLRFMNDYLAPEGEVLIVTEGGNRAYDASLPKDAIGSGLQYHFYLQSMIDQEILLTEVRRVNSHLLPEGYKTNFYQDNLSQANNFLASVGGKYASSARFVSATTLQELRNDEENNLRVLAQVGDLHIDVVRITNVKDWTIEHVPLPQSTTSNIKANILTNSHEEQKLVVSCYSKDNSKTMDVIFRKQENGWEVFYNRASGYNSENQTIEAKAFADALSIFYELSKNDPRFKTSSLAIEIDWERLGIKSTDQSTIDQAVQRLLQTPEFVSLEGWQYQDYLTTNSDRRETTGILLKFSLEDASKTVVRPTVPTVVIEIKNFEKRFKDDGEIGEVLDELNPLSTEQVAFYIKSQHAQRLVAIIFASEGWGISFRRKIADFLIKFPTLAKDLRATIEKNISKITDQLLEQKIMVLLNVIPAQGNTNIVELREADLPTRDKIEALSAEIDEKWRNRTARLAPFADLKVKELQDFSETVRAEILRNASINILQSIFFYNNIVYDLQELAAVINFKFAGHDHINLELLDILKMALSTQDELRDIIPTAYLKLFTFSVDQQRTLFAAREYYGEDLLQQNLQRLTSDDRDVIIDVGACEYDFTKELLLANRNSKIIAIEPLIRIGKNKFAELLEKNPRLICHIGLARDLTDRKFNQIAKLIYILFPMPALMDTGEYQVSIVQLLAPGGEVILVTELANVNLDPTTTGLISEFTAFFNIEDGFIVERRKVNCQLLPTSLHSTFYNDSFANPNRHFVHLDNNGSGMWTEMSEPILELVASGQVPGYKLVKDGGSIEGLFLDVIKIKSVEGWENEKIDLPPSFTGQADLIKSGDEEILVVSCFDESKTTKEDFVFRKNNDSWTIFCDSTDKLKGKNFKNALALFTELSKKDKRFETKTLAIEIDWYTLGVRSTEKTVVDAAVQGLLNQEELSSLPGNWQYQDYQITNSDPKESTGVFLRFSKYESVSANDPKINAVETTGSLSSQFWKTVVSGRAVFIGDVENLARELKVALTTEQATTIFNSPDFEKLSIDFFEGNITPTQYLEELKNKFQANGINPDNLDLFLRLAIQSFANRFIALSSVVCVPYSPETFYKEYLGKVYQTALEIKEGKVGCMFAKPSLVSGKFFFMPVKKGNEEKCATIGYKNFIDHPELEVLYYLPEVSPSDHAQAGDVVYHLYQKIIKASFERLQKELAGKKELTLGRNTLFSILTRTDIIWRDIEQILSLPTVRKFLLEMIATDRYVGIVPQYYDPKLDILDQNIIFAVSQTYQDCAPEVRHPRWASHLGIFVNRQRDLNNLNKMNIDQMQKQFTAWYKETIGFKYSQGVFIPQIPLVEDDMGSHFFNNEAPLLVAEILQKMPELLSKIIMGSPELASKRNKHTDQLFRFKRL